MFFDGCVKEESDSSADDPGHPLQDIPMDQRPWIKVKIKGEYE